MSYGKFLDELGDLVEWRKKNNLPEQHYEKTFADLRDIWIRDKRFSELIAFIHENWDSGQFDNFTEPFEKYLIKENQLSEFKKLWKGLLRIRINDLWDYLKYSKQDGNKYQNWTTRIQEQQAFSLKGIERFKNGLQEFKDINEISKLDTMIESIKKLEKPKPKPTSDKRKLDETVFWELINNNRQKTENKGDFLVLLSHQLEEFKPTEIRRFGKIFLTKIQELNHWDLWALAYIVRRGCGDDAFDYFKAWVISKGQKAFENIKNLRVQDLKTFFDEEPQLEDMFYLAEKVYENKTGELMSPIKVKKQKLIGKNWDENNVKNEFPELCKLFDYK